MVFIFALRIENYIKVKFIWKVVSEVVLMLKMKKVSETYDLKVFTDAGDYFGDIEDACQRFKITFALNATGQNPHG